MENKNELMVIVGKCGLDTPAGHIIYEKFKQFYDQIQAWDNKAKTLIVTNASQVDEMKMAREGRLFLARIRIDANKVRNTLKEDSIKYGKAVQSVYNFIEGLTTPIEKYLENQEKFVERQEEKRVWELVIARRDSLEPYEEFVPFGINLGVMSDDAFERFFKSVKIQKDEKIKQEADEKERVKKEKELYEQTLEENKKLKEELSEVKVLTKEPEILNDDSLSDKEKLLEFAKFIDNFKLPEVKSKKAKEIMLYASKSFYQTSVYLFHHIEEL
ncbi:hypothetical protein KKE60_07010 [Patescibacteria group bacterium]|uniref:Uncharacterized protein n=1 Tax=viral metagenome TaxID=1070528 RepID=A0A6M3M261_9ZZZZ|nr:hypothetical protein [Patescibacteria group bacterium]